LRFTADVLPRFSSISYSMCCPSLSVLSPARSTAETWTNTSLPPPAAEWIHSPWSDWTTSPCRAPLSISQLTIRDIILIGGLPANAATELCTSGCRCVRRDWSPHTNKGGRRRACVNRQGAAPSRKRSKPMAVMPNLGKSGKEDSICSPTLWAHARIFVGAVKLTLLSRQRRVKVHRLRRSLTYW